MKYRFKYETPKQFSNMIIETDGQFLTGLWFTDALAEGEHYRWGSRQDMKLRTEAAERDGAAAGRIATGAPVATAEGSADNAEIQAVADTVRWLDMYFRGEQPDFWPAMSIEGATAFRMDVIDQMRRIPFGQTVTYGDIAKRIARRRDKKTMSAQAVGGAVGWNPICIIIPCHRVLGAGGAITGYGGGVANKVELLKLEGVIR